MQLPIITDDEGNVVSYSVDSQVDGLASIIEQTKLMINAEGKEPGTHVVMLVLTDQNGNQSVEYIAIKIEPDPTEPEVIEDVPLEE